MFRQAPTVPETPLLPPTHPRVDFTVKSLRALASLRAESEILAEHARGLGFEHPQVMTAARAIVGRRAAIYRAARAMDERFPASSPSLPLDVSLRAFYEDDIYSARRWPARLDTFVDAPVDVLTITERGMHVLVEARVAAVYGLLDAAMAIIDHNLRFDNPDRRAQIERRFRHLHARSLLLMQHRGTDTRVAPTEPAPPDASTDTSPPDASTNTATPNVVTPNEPVTHSTVADDASSIASDTNNDAASVAGDFHGQQEERIEEAREENPRSSAAGAGAAPSGEPRSPHSSGPLAGSEEGLSGAAHSDNGAAHSDNGVGIASHGLDAVRSSIV